MKPGRNDGCPCGSGRKYKRCCGAPASEPSARTAPVSRDAVNPMDLGALVALIGDDRLSEAERGARRLLGRHPGAGMAWKILGVALMRQGRDALEPLRRAAELLPDDPEVHHNLGTVLGEQGLWAPALDSLRRALELAPDDVDCLVDTADAMRASGQAQEAVPVYERALRLDPRRIEAQNNLGNAFLELARFADAAAWYRGALRLKPDDAQILCNLGGVERCMGNLEAAAASYRRAVELQPQRAENHWNLGCVLFDLRRSHEAVASYARALALKPDLAPAHLSLGLALRQQRRPADAEASCLAALAIAPHYVEALSFLGELRADRGRFADAEALFQQAITLAPDFAPAYFSIAIHRKMTRDDGAWLQGATGLLARRLPPGHEISLRYALGKYHDDVEQYAEAFEHYRQANELTKRQGSTYDREKFSRRVDRILRTFDAAFVHGRASAGSDSERPVFIVGMPRSGTSLTEQILASHPAVFGAGELPFWDVAYGAYHKAELEGARGADRIPAMAADYLERLTASGADAPRVVDKMPANFLYAGLIHAAFPRARIIHMQRHPLDTCLSIYFQNFFSMGPYANDLENLAHYYREYLRTMDHWRAVLPPTALLEVPYEALIDDQEGWTRRMLDFVDLPWDPKCLDFHRTDRVVITASKWQVRQKIHGASAGRFRHYEPWLGPLRDALGAEALRYPGG